MEAYDCLKKTRERLECWINRTCNAGAAWLVFGQLKAYTESQLSMPEGLVQVLLGADEVRQ